jgi:hypothetical protein
VAVQDRVFNPANGVESANLRQVVEHDMDMRRSRPQESMFTSRLAGLMRWFTPGGREIGSPMRSVAREIEELWPSRDR